MIYTMISVIIPYKEDRGYLETAIQSVEGQSFTDWEIILSQGDRTQGANINEGVIRAKGEFIKILHDDDYLPHNSLQYLFDGIQGYDWICGDALSFGEEMYCPNPQVYRGKVPVLDQMIEQNYVYGGTTMYRKEIVDYNEDLPTGEEYELHLRLLKNGYKVNYTPHIVHHYRLHKYNKSHYMGPGEKRERRDFIKEIASWYR